MSDEKTPLPDLLGSRNKNAGAPLSGLTMEEAMEQNPDLKKLFQDLEECFGQMVRVNDDMLKAAQANLATPGAQEKLFGLQMTFSRLLDETLNKLNVESSQIRVEILREIYATTSPHWKSMVLQLHMMRGQAKRPGQVHQMLLGEATSLMNRLMNS